MNRASACAHISARHAYSPMHAAAAAAGRSLQGLLGSYTRKEVCLKASTIRSPHTAVDRASACTQLSNMRIGKCTTTTTGASQQNMGVAGPSLQGLYGRRKRGVRPHEPRIAHSSAAGERKRKAIKHTCWHQPGPENKCRLARSASGQGSPSTTPGRFLSNSLEQHTGNWTAGQKWLSSTKTIPLPSNTGNMHMQTLTVLEPGRKRKRDKRQEWAQQIRLYNCHQVHIHLLMSPIRCHTKTYMKPVLMP